jgi:hypothetical protein
LDFVCREQESVLGDSSLHLAAAAGDDDLLTCLLQYLKESGQVGYRFYQKACAFPMLILLAVDQRFYYL